MIQVLIEIYQRYLMEKSERLKELSVKSDITEAEKNELQELNIHLCDILDCSIDELNVKLDVNLAWHKGD